MGIILKKTGIRISLLMLVFSLSLMLDVQPIKAIGTIYIRADGSIDPPTAPIQRNGNVYTLTGNITSDTDGIVVERDGIVLNGAGYAVTGSGSGNGIWPTNRSKVTVRNMRIRNFYYGIALESSNNNTLFGNNMADNSDIANNDVGIDLGYSSNNSVFGNNLHSNGCGIAAYYSNDNSLYENSITDNDVGLELAFFSSNNKVTGNVIVNDSVGIELSYSSNGNEIAHNNVTANLKSGITVGYRVPEVSGGLYYGGCSGTNILKNVIMFNGRGIGVICSNQTETFHNRRARRIIASKPTSTRRWALIGMTVIPLAAIIGATTMERMLTKMALATRLTSSTKTIRTTTR